mmetsp:Transcript_7901/g.18334  ORF Transcript_7901/g.18334 Transcript_7901/m.18334 type:complete len:193 (+) Transcript_7901:3-581(+)
MGISQPVLNGSKFILFDKYVHFEQWEVLPLIRKGIPLLKALEVQLPRLCSMPLKTQVELFDDASMRHGPTCWAATWIFAMLRDGIGFSTKGFPQLDVVPSCCDHTLGHATYEVNFFPYKVSRSSYMSLAAKKLHLVEDAPKDADASAAAMLPHALSFLLGAALAGPAGLLLARRQKPLAGSEPLLQETPRGP